MAETLNVADMLPNRFEPKRNYRWVFAIEGIDSFLIKSAARPNISIGSQKIDFINSWKKGNKKDNIFDIAIRLGRFTILELYCNPKVEHRIIVLNFGWGIYSNKKT